MASYVVNVNDPTTPTQSQPARQGAEELRAIKALLTSLIVAGSSSASPRQAIQSAVLDANGYNNAITVGAGLRPGLTASVADAYHLSAANGFSVGKAINIDEVIAANNADILGADLPLSNTSFLYRTIGVGFASTLIPPQYGYTFDRTQGSILNFEGADGAVATIDDFGNTWTFNGNAQIDTAQFKFGTASLLLDGTGDYVTSTNFTTLGDGSWEMMCWFRINALPGAGTDASLFEATNSANFGVYLQINNTAGTVKLKLGVSSNGTSTDVANNVLGTNTTWNLNEWNRARVVFDALAGTYRVYLSLNGAAETQDQTTSSTARVCAIEKIRVGANTTAGANFNGWIDAFRFIHAATKTTTEVPAIVIPEAII